MSLHMNATLPIGAADGWLGAAQAFAQTSPTRALVLALVNIPVLAIVINVLLQLLPKDPSLPPVVFHWFPFVGSAVSYGDDPLNFFFKCKEKYGDVFTFILLGRRVTVALGPRGNNFVLGGKSRSFNAEEAYKHLTVPVFGKDVVYDVPNEIFMEQKKFVKVGLSTENFRAYVGMIEEEVEHFMDNDPSWKTWQADDITEWGTLTDVVDALSEITILTASRTLQGKEVRAGLDKSFAGLYTDLDGGFTPLNFMFPNLPLPSYRRRDVAQARMSTFYQDIIARRRARGSVAGDDEHDMLAALMEQTYRSGRPLQDHEMAHIMIALLMAGQHTSSATGSWALLHLAANPAVADELYEEQVKHFGQPDGSFRSMTFEELRDLPVLDSVIRETLRLHPPIHSIMRYVQDAVPVPATLGAPAAHKRDAQPYVVPVGHYVLASPLVSQMDPGTWRDATAWEPARWLDPAGVAARAFAEYTDEGGEKIDFGFGAVSKGTDSPYQPFGAGRHRCIGEQFAYLQLGTIIATIIRRVEVRLQGAFPAHNYHTMITMPTSPRKISYRRRKHAA